MKIIEIKRDNGNICIFYNNKLIEQYKLTEAIDFKELMKLLISDELSNKFQCNTDENLKHLPIFTRRILCTIIHQPSI